MSVIWLHFVPSFLAITRNLTRFLKDDVKQMKDTRGYFNKISSDLDSSLNKNSAVSKSKPNEIEECTNLLQATQSCFRYTALDYVYQVRNQIHMKFLIWRRALHFWYSILFLIKTLVTVSGKGTIHRLDLDLRSGYFVCLFKRNW